MKSPSVSSAKATANPKPTPGSNYAPSVPITVYRELAAELQATKASLDQINQRNQQLAQENQLLRQEMERVVNQALQLQQVLQTGTPAAAVHPARAEAEHMAQQIRSGHYGSSATATDSRDSLLSDDLFTEQPDLPANRTANKKAPKELGGIWLTLLVVAIIITAFGAGFILVRPYLKGR